uniref:Uncharacterized protein n=1 Tax=Cacopsylla melanoneura TaxID=428564 RepID=A0A8D8QD83_9HEMI
MSFLFIFSSIFILGTSLLLILLLHFILLFYTFLLFLCLFYPSSLLFLFYLSSLSASCSYSPGFHFLMVSPPLSLISTIAFSSTYLTIILLIILASIHLVSIF